MQGERYPWWCIPPYMPPYVPPGVHTTLYTTLYTPGYTPLHLRPGLHVYVATAVRGERALGSKREKEAGMRRRELSFSLMCDSW